MYGNVLAMHYLKGLDMSLDLPEIEMNGPGKYIVREREGGGGEHAEWPQKCKFIPIINVLFIKRNRDKLGK